MFNNLAAYLLGTTSSSATTQPTQQRNIQQQQLLHQHHQHQQQQLNSIRLNSSSTAILPVDVSDDEEEDDWVLVDREQGDDRDSEGNSTLESSSEEEGDSDNEQSPTKMSVLRQSTPEYDITDLLLLSSSTTPSPVHTSSYHLLSHPATYAITSLSSPAPTIPHTQSTTTTTPSNLHHQQQQLVPIVVNTMEDSWFLTPPPCFTSTGPVHMETSPLENLLIEHPSMSVYQNVTVTGGLFLNRAGAGRTSVSGAMVEASSSQASNSSASSSITSTKPDSSQTTTTTTVVLLEELSSDLEDEAAEASLFEIDEEVERGYLRAAQQHQRRRRGNGQRGYNRVAASGEVLCYQQRQERHQRLVAEQEGIRNKQAQKVQIQKACQSLKRSYLERNNKAREVNYRNQRLRRGERSQGSTRSNANNNRKCS